MLRRRAAAALIGCVVAGAAAVALVRHRPRPVAPVAAPDAPVPIAFVGESACAGCHPHETAAWKGSHHQLAMQPANASTVLGDFGDARFSYAGVESRFFRRDGKLVARTDGPDGSPHDYEITHTFGVAPLQQYLVALPGGRLQALEIAWDSRPRAAGGQRWFHLYPGQRIDSRDPLHWTGVAESWNFMCADCHSTNVRKAYDAQAGTYATSFAEMSVACEACHGPGSRHVSWARGQGGGRRDDSGADGHGLLVALDERRGVAWSRDPATGLPHRSAPRRSAREIETCARCHARRGLIHEDFVHGQRLGDDYRVANLDDGLYYPDGQIKDEVYEYGSFVQSRMFAEGVTCSDCHDPHRPELRAAGDNLCLQCHAQERYFTAKHHFHATGSAGSRCVACHMPAATYMVVDRRRDHSLRVPRPDQTETLGVPNACNGCHADRPARWAARTVERWYGHVPSGHQRFAEALAAGNDGAPGAQSLLAALVADPGQPAIARASALDRMAHHLAPATLPALQVALGDPDPLVRRAAIQALADVDPGVRDPLVSPLLADPVRAVRIEAAAALSGSPLDLMPAPARAALAGATAELVAARELNADRPEAHLDLAALYAKQGLPVRAEAELRRALVMEPAFVPAAVNLADLYRATGRDRDAEPVLREALAHTPDNPALMHALGLTLVREQRVPESIVWLGGASRRGPENPRYGYVFAVALHGQGQRREAMNQLVRVLARHPYDRDALAAMAAFTRESGDLQGAEAYAARLAALDGSGPR
jgi:predicted CXXCH cytochrome family protein